VGLLREMWEFLCYCFGNERKQKVIVSQEDKLEKPAEYDKVETDDLQKFSQEDIAIQKCFEAIDEGFCVDCKCEANEEECVCGCCRTELPTEALENLGVPEDFHGEKRMRKVYHVVPNQKGGWLVKEERNKNPSARAEKKSEAVKKAKELAKKTKLGQVIVHKKNGQIQTEYTYGDDPVKTKG
jgi:hypothetical protein